MNGTQVSIQTGTPSVDYIIAIGTIATAIILGTTLYLQWQDRKPKIDTLQREKQNDGVWKIFIHNPTKIMEECNIEFNGTKLLSENGLNHARIGLGKGTRFIMPANVSDNDEHFLIIREGRTTILKIKFRDVNNG